MTLYHKKKSKNKEKALKIQWTKKFQVPQKKMNFASTAIIELNVSTYAFGNNTLTGQKLNFSSRTESNFAQFQEPNCSKTERNQINEEYQRNLEVSKELGNITNHTHIQKKI